MRRLSGILLVVALGASAPVFAFPWMVRHDYQSCASCHVDPSGGGQLALYGRAQSDVLLRWKLTQPKPEEDTGEIPASARFLWFLETPEALNLSGNLRAGALIEPGGATPVIPLVMATDLYATVKLDRFVAHVTTGLGIKRTEKATVFPICDVSKGACGVSMTAREFWLGAKFADESVMLRAGRMNLPFGLRNNEHTMWVRDLTHTNLNLDQQVGASLAYNGEKIRGEIMGIAGNFQVGPDAYRERGYSAFAEYAVSAKTYFGLSSLIAGARADLSSALPLTRHAHGAMLRWSPADIVSILAEADLLVWQTPGALDRIGFASLVQADFEVVQGLHLIGSLEAKHEGAGEAGPSVGGWGSVAWYALPHVEVRVDTYYRRVTSYGVPPNGNFAILAQLHVFL